MARQPLRVRAAALTLITLGMLLTACSAPGRGEPTTLEHPAPTTQGPSAGHVGPGADDYVDPAQVSEALPVPEPTPVGLPDLVEHDLSPKDEAAALAAAEDFVTTIWTWDYTDDSDRAGLQRALPLATPRLQGELRPYLAQPIYSPEERSADATAGSAVQVLTLGPAPEGTFDADTYTVQVVYRLFSLDDAGSLVPRDEDARRATLEVARAPDDRGWLVAALPYLRIEQVVEGIG